MENMGLLDMVKLMQGSGKPMPPWLEIYLQSQGQMGIPVQNTASNLRPVAQDYFKRGGILRNMYSPFGQGK